MHPVARLDVVALDCREPRRLAEFYAALAGWRVTKDLGDWIEIHGEGAVGLAFQLVEDYEPPVWPGAAHPQQAHLDFDVDDLDVMEARVLELGARKAEYQPDPSFRVFLDPAGHPFCLVASDA